MAHAPRASIAVGRIPAFRASLACCAALLCAAAHGARFDCGAVHTPVEKAICNNPELSTLDNQLTEACPNVPKNNKEAGSMLKDQQRRWLKSRLSDHTGILKAAYRARIEYLRMLSGLARINAEFRFEKISRQRAPVLQTLTCPKEEEECATPAQLLIYNKG